ncbi:MAG: glycosyltransferase, partial [Bacteroidota bacterium]
PNTLSEAMLCECVPVGSDVNGIPDAMGETGIIIRHRHVEELEHAVRKALTFNSGAAARQHVLNNFTLLQREEKLLKLLSEYT